MQKPYKCEVVGCSKRYTDPSSLRKHVKGHSTEEQLQYRRSKDLANIAKRSNSPTNRYANWVPPPTQQAIAPPQQQGLEAAGHGSDAALSAGAASQQHHHQSGGGCIQLVNYPTETGQHLYSQHPQLSSGNVESKRLKCKNIVCSFFISFPFEH